MPGDIRLRGSCTNTKRRSEDLCTLPSSRPIVLQQYPIKNYQFSSESAANMDESSPGSPKVELNPTFESIFSSIKQRVTFSKSKKVTATTDLSDGKAANIQQVSRVVTALYSLQ